MNLLDGIDHAWVSIEGIKVEHFTNWKDIDEVYIDGRRVFKMSYEEAQDLVWETTQEAIALREGRAVKSTQCPWRNVGGIR